MVRPVSSFSARNNENSSLIFSKKPKMQLSTQKIRLYMYYIFPAPHIQKRGGVPLWNGWTA